MTKKMGKIGHNVFLWGWLEGADQWSPLLLPWCSVIQVQDNAPRAERKRLAAQPPLHKGPVQARPVR